jgi:hypothetical protein
MRFMFWKLIFYVDQLGVMIKAFVMSTVSTRPRMV